MVTLSNLKKVYLISEREDIVTLIRSMVDDVKTLSTLDFTVEKEWSFDALFILDASILNYYSTSFFYLLEQRPYRMICIMPAAVSENIKKYVDNKFKYILPFPVQRKVFLENCNKIMSRGSENCAYNEEYQTFTNKESLFGCFVGNSNKIRSVRTKIENAGQNDYSVLLVGETGTGKTTAAEIIHKLSYRHKKGMKSLNISTVVDSLASSTFFGTEKGAYTDAVHKEGLFKEAHNSTLFLDEIGVASLSVQKTLLTALGSGIIQKVGSNNLEKVDVRLITATNEDLDRQMRIGEFRKDLFYRISDLIIKIPALRERKEDIPQIVESFMKKYNKTVTQNALDKIIQYDWPGNIRELHQCLKRAISETNENYINEENIDFGLFNS